MIDSCLVHGTLLSSRLACGSVERSLAPDIPAPCPTGETDWYVRLEVENHWGDTRVKKMRSILQGAEGSSLRELVVVLAIMAILTAVAVPNFISYRDRSQVAAAVATVESIRAALSAYAADDPNNLYPASVTDYAALVALANPLGAPLPVNPADVGIAALTYEAEGTPAGSTYTLTVITLAPAGVRGYKLTVAPGGVIQSRS